MKRIRCPHCKGSGRVPIPRAFGERCAFERARRGLQFRDVARAVKMSAGTVHRVEQGGRPYLHNARKLADFYGFKLREVTL